MAIKNSKLYFQLSLVVFFASFSKFCTCIRVNSFNESLVGFQTAIGTFYNDPTIYGSGGACGFENDVAKPPYSGLITAGNQVLFQHGKGCGICYEVFCNENPECSGKSIKVTLTDECPGTCNDDPVHFDLSEFAYRLLAKPGRDDFLYTAGRINIQYQRVPCDYPGQSILFKVDKGSNQWFFAVAIEYENGDGDIGLMEIQPVGSSTWFPMQQMFGATYKYDVPTSVKGPYSIRITSGLSNKSIVAENVIPIDWQPGQYYKSSVNF